MFVFVEYDRIGWAACSHSAECGVSEAPRFPVSVMPVMASILTIYLHKLLPRSLVLAVGELVIVDVVARVGAVLGLFL